MATIPASGDRIGEWIVVRELGRGGMATVHEVESAGSGVHRALKLMLPGTHSEEELTRFHREFHALSRLDHPHVAQVLEGGLYDERPYFVMELLEGRELREEVETWRELPPAERFRRAEAVLVQLTRALAYIHEQGLVHRDVTPSNIMIAPDGTARLMDFGVVKEPGGDLTTVGEVVGTIAYIAPEQIEGGLVDARADLYCLGAVLYLMLTGRRPFNARTIAGYMEKHLTRPVRPPRELAPTIPPLLDAVCLRLLEKDREDRYASAQHLLYLLLDARAEAPGENRTLRMVGRASEMAGLREVIARLQPGPGGEAKAVGGLVVISGAPGMGRTRVAEDLKRQARALGLAVSHSRNRAPDQRAFEGLRTLYQDLLRDTGLPAPPALASVFDDQGSPVTVERWAVLQAMKELASHSGPRVVIMGDPDRADRATLELLEYLVRNLVGTGGRPLLFVLTRQAPGADDPLRGLLEGESTGVPAEHLLLGPISVAAVEELLLGVVHDHPALREVAVRLHKEGEGNPFLITEMVLGLVDDGVIAIEAGNGRGTFEWDPSDVERLVLPVPRSIREAIREHLEPLGHDARVVADVLAVAWQEVDFDLVAEVTRLPEERLLAAIDELLAAGLVRERRVGVAERFELSRNRLRDVLDAEISPESKVVWHLRIGECLERIFRRRSEAVVEVLAHHFEQGGVPAKAFAYLVRAAEKMRARALMAEALQYLDRAAALEPNARAHLTLDEAEHRLADLKLHRSTVLFHLGQWTEADVEARQADALARDLGDERLQARAAVELASHARRVRQLDVAEAELRRALEIAQRLGDKRLQIVPLYEFGAIQWARGDLEGARDYFIQALAGSEAYQDERALALGYNGLGLIALCRGQSAEARRYFEQSIEVCEKFGLMERLTVARTNLVEVYHLTGNLRKGIELADHTVAHAREVRHRYGIALGLRYRVIMLTDLGRNADAIENAEEALRIQEELDNSEEVLASLVVLIRAVLALGDHDRARELIIRAVALLPAYDSEGFAPLVHAWRARICAESGEIDRARASLLAARGAPGRQWPFQLARLDLNLSRAHGALGERAQALAAAEEALTIADASGYRNYSMRARQLAARYSDDEVAAARHERIAKALARSLSANLPREDVAVFLAIQGVDQRRADSLGREDDDRRP